MSKEAVKLSRTQQIRLSKALLSRQPVNSDLKVDPNGRSNLWVNTALRDEYFRARRLKRLARMDQLREQGFEMSLLPRVASSDSGYLHIKGKDFNLEIQTLSDDQKLSEADTNWIMTLEISESLSNQLTTSDRIQLVDDQGRAWCRFSYNKDRYYIWTWQERESPIELLGRIRLHLQVI